MFRGGQCDENLDPLTARHAFQKQHRPPGAPALAGPAMVSITIRPQTEFATSGKNMDSLHAFYAHISSKVALV
jgi:hypothetical protein